MNTRHHASGPDALAVPPARIRADASAREHRPDRRQLFLEVMEGQVDSSAARIGLRPADPGVARLDSLNGLAVGPGPERTTRVGEHCDEAVTNLHYPRRCGSAPSSTTPAASEVMLRPASRTVAVPAGTCHDVSAVRCEVEPLLADGAARSREAANGGAHGDAKLASPCTGRFSGPANLAGPSALTATCLPRHRAHVRYAA